AEAGRHAAVEDQRRDLAGGEGRLAALPPARPGLGARQVEQRFSFCVALYEALYGTPPFRGDNLITLASAVLSGEVAEAPRESYARVPPWLRKVLLRGLSVDPADRYPSIAALLDDLTRDPSSQRRRWLVGLGVAAAVGLGAAGWAQLRASDDALCDGAAEQLQGVWDPSRMREVEAAFAAAGDPTFAAETFRRVEAHS